MARRSSSPLKHRSRLRGIFLFLLGFLAGAGSLYFGCRNVGRESEGPAEARSTAPDHPRTSPAPSSRPPRPHRKASRPVEATAASAAPLSVPAPPEPHSAAPPEPAAPRTGAEGPVAGVRIALVIDDLGRSVEDVETLGRLGIPITYAVLPFESETPAVVAAIHRLRAEILCHLPMQPVNGQNPGPGALLYGMDREALQKATSAALAAVPGAVGVNNHMGSRLSADERSMRAVLGVLRDRGLFFLDSRTSPESVGYREAAKMGVPAAERQVFLDSDMRPQMVREQFLRTLEVAKKRGSAIAIGHPHPATLAMLAAEVPRARAEGYEFVAVSRLLDRPEGQPAR
ncbi:MAG: uncharacterized protein QOJ16_3930 [Acidobacteriota bacterium]|jgi:polysaccharide deacetylase 2 family uncharacterized protein YibQ|nr:uncharacterized protein [Acidobacteriota bacterium]